MTRRLQFIGTRQQRHDMKGFDGATASAVGLGHRDSFIGASIKNMIVMTTTHDSTQPPARRCVHRVKKPVVEHWIKESYDGAKQLEFI
ncbi:hypothetical protein A262_10777 [Pseudomonas syringae pv. actinidiae ICMP 19073]|nr:hypothetical protein A262_10777 [Pseudomonas syringae pv. actinidiae ICMP 19073]